MLVSRRHRASPCGGPGWADGASGGLLPLQLPPKKWGVGGETLILGWGHHLPLPSSRSLRHTPILAASARQSESSWTSSAADMGWTFKKAKKRPYLSDQKHFLDPLSRKNMALTCVKASVFAMQPRFEKIMDHEKRQDELLNQGQEEEDLDWGALFAGFPRDVRSHIFNLTSIQMGTRFLDWVGSCLLSERVMDRLTKDPMKSVLRKVQRANRVLAARKVVKTHWWATVNSYLSVFVFDELCLLYKYWKDNRHKHPRWQRLWLILHGRDSPAGTDKEKGVLIDWNGLILQTRRNLTRYLTSWFLSAVGYGIGTLIRPGLGSTGGSIAMDLWESWLPKLWSNFL